MSTEYYGNLYEFGRVPEYICQVIKQIKFDRKYNDDRYLNNPMNRNNQFI